MRQRTFALIVTLALTCACASISVKQSVSAAHQTVRGTLVALDDFERAICAPDPAATNRCTAQPVIVTDAVHQRVSRAFSQAYATDIRLGQAIIAWAPGQPVPTDLAALQTTVNEIRQAVTTLAPSPKVSEFFAKVDAVILRIQDLARQFAGGR